MISLSFNHLDKLLCYPDPEVFIDSEKRNELYLRNQWQLRFYLSFLLILSTLFVSMDINIKTHYYFLTTILLQLFSFVCFCRKRVRLYYIVYTLTVTLTQFFLVDVKKEYVLYAITSVFLTPLLVSTFTNNPSYVHVNFLGQIILVHVKYKNRLEQTLKETNFKEFASEYINSTLAILFAVSFVYYFLICSLQNSLQKLKTSKHQTDQECYQLKVFLQVFSHEVKNPLMSLLGSLDLALHEKFANQASEILEGAKISGDLLLQLVNNLLDAGKAQAGKLEICQTCTSPKEIFVKVWRMCRDLIQKKNLNGVLKIDENLPNLAKLDPYRLSQILLNLLGNAIKFTNSGFIWMTIDWIPNGLAVKEEDVHPYDEEGIFEKNENIKTLSRNVNVKNSQCFSLGDFTQSNLENFEPEILKQHGLIKILIKDTGCGIKEDDLNLVFDKYSQVSKDPCARKIGTGLGLYITKEICTRMGGQIKVYSKENIGTTFIVYIPI